MGYQPTASKTGLLLQCARPFAEDTVLNKETGSSASYGSAWHECADNRTRRAECDVPAILAKWNVTDASAEEMSAHVNVGLEVLIRWMGGDNPFGERFRVVDTEKHLATSIRKASPLRPARDGEGRFQLNGFVVRSRECGFDEETHHYDLRGREIGGTFDVLLESDVLYKTTNGRMSTPAGQLARSEGVGSRLCVLDYKTGDWGDFRFPSRLPQMRTLALQTGAEIVAILHAPRNLPAVVYAEEITPADLSAHVREIRRAQSRIGDGSLRPGPECRYCEAKDSCPAKDGELLDRAGALVKASLDGLVPAGALTQRIDPGRFHQLLGELDKLAKRGREELKAAVAEGAVIERPDGKVLVIEEREYERLSKASILEGLGKAAGNRMLESFRKKGALTVEKRLELHARKG